jgi:hypothetical protein
MTLHDVADAEYDAYLGALVDFAEVQPSGHSLRGAIGSDEEEMYNSASRPRPNSAAAGTAG